MAELVFNSKAWTSRIAERIESGERFSIYVERVASDLLGRPILRGGKHAARPDAKDRQAGDFTRDEYVPL